MNTNLASIIKANDICNRAGLDTISAGGAIAFAIECYENGILTKSDTDGIEMTWGNHRSIIAMTEKLARREGLGDILADGVKKAAERIGKARRNLPCISRGRRSRDTILKQVNLRRYLSTRCYTSTSYSGRMGGWAGESTRTKLRP